MNNNHILNINPMKIGKINNEYHFVFLNEFDKFIDTKYYYDLLLYINLQNLYDYLNIKWYKLNISINNKDYTNNHILIKTKIINAEMFNNLLMNFINHTYAVSIFFINILLRYIS